MKKVLGVISLMVPKKCYIATKDEANQKIKNTI
jgi:hypothetical protein